MAVPVVYRRRFPGAAHAAIKSANRSTVALNYRRHKFRSATLTLKAGVNPDSASSGDARAVRLAAQWDFARRIKLAMKL